MTDKIKLKMIILKEVRNKYKETQKHGGRNNITER